MNKDQLIKHFREWRDNDENEKIVAAYLVLPQEEVDNEILMWLAQAYIDIEEYKRAISTLEGMHESMEDDYKWHFMMGVALLRAINDEECYDSDELKTSVLERAKVCFARGMNMNPPDNLLDTADKFMEEIEMLLDEINGPAEEDYGEEVECYDDEEYDAVENHIKEYFGDFPTIFHEVTSRDFICDIACIPPSEERNYYTLVTMGMGAHIMNVPETLSVEENGRAELLICLPPDWKLGENSPEWFWPISLLKSLAKLPLNHDSWLGWGHSIDNRSSLSPNSDFNTAFLIFPEEVPKGAEYCVLPNGDRVNFFEVIPLYFEEMLFKISYGAKALLERMNSVDHVVDITRPNVCEGMGFDEKPSSVIDDAQRHSRKIKEKGLPLDEINGCNHIAIYLRWCIEHDFIALEFYENCHEAVKGVKDGTNTDLRQFINDSFFGCIDPFQFSFVASCFADYYYNWRRKDPPHYYPSDVDDYAERYFGTEKYNSEEFQDEAYLFVPFDENYYREMSKYINRAFEDFLPGFIAQQHISDVRTSEEAATQLGLKLEVPNLPEFAKAFRNIEYSAKTDGCSALPVIVETSGADDSTKAVLDILQDACDPFLITMAAARFPAANPMEWAAEHFSKEKPVVVSKDKQIVLLCSRLKEKLGAVPAIFAFDEESTALFLPLENGDYLKYSR